MIHLLTSPEASAALLTLTSHEIALGCWRGHFWC